MGLIELLVSIFLGTLLFIGLIQVFLIFQRTWSWQNTWASMQERQRYITHLFEDRIKIAGIANCERDYLVHQALAIHGYSFQSAPENFRRQMRSNTDALVIGECVHYRGLDQFVQIAYYISDSGRKDARGKPIYSLYEKPLVGEREELVSRISELHLRYGVASAAGDGVNEVSSEAVADWEKVRSVKLVFQIASEMDGFYKIGYLYVCLRERG